MLNRLFVNICCIFIRNKKKKKAFRGRHIKASVDDVRMGLEHLKNKIKLKCLEKKPTNKSINDADIIKKINNINNNIDHNINWKIDKIFNKLFISDEKVYTLSNGVKFFVPLFPTDLIQFSHC